MSHDDDPIPAYYIGTNDDLPPSDLTDHLAFEITPLTPSRWPEEPKDRSVFFELSVIQNNPDFGRELIEQIRDTGLIGFGLPPVERSSDEIQLTAFPDREISLQLDEQTGPVSISRDFVQSKDPIELSIAVLGHFTQFRGRALAHNADNHPVIVEWQPRSTSGRLIVSTIELTKLAITGNEQHRRELLQYLVEYISSIIKEKPSGKDDTDSDAPETTITRTQFNNGLLALYVLSHQRDTVPLTLERLENTLPNKIGFTLSDEEWSVFLTELEDKNIVEGAEIDESVLANTISERNLTSYTRRLLNG